LLLNSLCGKKDVVKLVGAFVELIIANVPDPLEADGIQGTQNFWLGF
jgi:hypothetical protein